jgi:hypothetical protein
MDYSKVDAEELKEEIYLRQMIGIPDVLPRSQESLIAAAMNRP